MARGVAIGERSSQIGACLLDTGQERPVPEILCSCERLEKCSRRISEQVLLSAADSVRNARQVRNRIGVEQEIVGKVYGGRICTRYGPHILDLLNSRRRVRVSNADPRIV